MQEPAVIRVEVVEVVHLYRHDRRGTWVGWLFSVLLLASTLVGEWREHCRRVDAERDAAIRQQAARLHEERVEVEQDSRNPPCRTISSGFARLNN